MPRAPIAQLGFISSTLSAVDDAAALVLLFHTSFQFMQRPPNYRIRFLCDLLKWRTVVPYVVVALMILGCKVYLVLVFLSVYLAGQWQYVSFQKYREAGQVGAKEIPRVNGKWPGNIDILLRIMRKGRTAYIRQNVEFLLDEYGCDTLNTRILWKDQIITRDARHIKCALATQFDAFEKGYYFTEKMWSFLGNGIFNSDGDTWRKHRAMTRPFFVRERISDIDILDRQSSIFIEVLDRVTTTEPAFDVQDLFLRFTMDVACEFLFGTTTGSLSRPLPIAGHAKLGPKGSAADGDFGTFTQAFEQVQVVQSRRFLLGDIWPLFELLTDKSLKPVKIIRRWTEPIIENAIRDKDVHQSPDGLDNRLRTLLSDLLDSTDDKDLVHYELLNILMAARDTTATLMTFVIYLLCLHPRVTVRLREELVNVFGNDARPEYSRIQDLKYMRAVINETLRIFPPVPLGVRNTKSQGVALPSDEANRPYYMPANTQIMILSTGLHRSPKFWGDDSNEFRPERWLDPAQIAAVSANPHMFIPFFEGPRICPGQQFALTEATYLLSRILQRYSSFELCPEYQPAGSEPPEAWKNKAGRQSIERCWPATAFTLYAKGGLWVRATPTAVN